MFRNKKNNVNKICGKRVWLFSHMAIQVVTALLSNVRLIKVWKLRFK